MKKIKLKNKSMLSVIVFFLLLFTPITAYADEVVKPENTSGNKSGDSNFNENTMRIASNESETITDTNATFTGTYDTEEEAQNKEAEKEAEYSNAGYENIQSEITEVTTEEETGNMIEEYIGSTITTEEEAYVFDNETDANNKKDELESSTDPHDAVITVEITVRSVDSGEDEVTQINETFNSEAEAQAYLEQLEADGYTIISSSFTHDTEEKTGSIDQLYDTYNAAQAALEVFEQEYDEVESNIKSVSSISVNNATTHTNEPIFHNQGRTYIIMRVGNTIYVWTERELSISEQSEFKSSYKSVARDRILTGNAVDSNSTVFIHGYGWFGSFPNRFNVSLFVPIIPGARSEIRVSGNPHMVYGTFGTNTKYQLTATGKSTTELESGILTGEKSKDIMVDEYVLNVTTETKNYNYTPETIDKTTYYLVVKADIPQENQKYKESEKKENKDLQETNVVNPQTSDSIVKYAAVLTLSVGLGLAGALMSRKLRLNK